MNEQIVHGIPSRSVVLKEGDIISIDTGAIVDGWVGDNAWTYAVGKISPEKKRLLDVTEREKRESLRREFTANVSHELKTPLQSILGSAELLKNGMVKQEDTAQFSGLIYKEAARLVALVEDIIHLSQLDEGAEMEWEAVDLLTLANSAVSALRDSAEKRCIQLSVTGESTQVNGVRVEISVSKGARGAVLTVKDTGIGIPPEFQPRVFERFFRVDKSRSKASGGTGLGLSIVKHIAQYHHAEIELHSDIGLGSTISVCFPTNKAEDLITQ